MNAVQKMDARGTLRQDFARRCGLAGWHEQLLAGDASFRRYWRWSDGTQRFVIMDAPPPQEDVRPFVRVARHLAGLGLSTPDVLQQDADSGFLLLEDFGDDTYVDVLARQLPAASGGDAPHLYALAADVLVHLHKAGGRALLEDVPLYLGEPMAEIATTLVDWYLPMAIGRAATMAERQSHLDAWRQVLQALDGLPRTLVLRDYHVGNLMWLPQRAAFRACGVLDFQDAGTGVAAFDVVSLIEDARRDIPETLRAATLERYCRQVSDADTDAFAAAMTICAGVRHSRVIGIFTRLSQRDGKPQYLAHLPRLWRHLDRALTHAALQPVRQWIMEWLPPSRRVFPTA